MLIRLLLVAGLLAGCSANEPEPRPDAGPPSTPGSSSVSPTRAPPPTGPTYLSSVRRLTEQEMAAMAGDSWHPGCPVPRERLRAVTVRRWDFSGHVRGGVLVVRADVASEVADIFGQLFRQHYPIRRMIPIDHYEGDDFDSIEADNTSSFNCRPVTGGSGWSHHAYGLAIDLNPLENPYVLHGRTTHPASVPYLDRERQRRGVILADGPVVRIFEDAGWYWGGDWDDPTDYQHFSKLPADAVIR